MRWFHPPSGTTNRFHDPVVLKSCTFASITTKLPILAAYKLPSPWRISHVIMWHLKSTIHLILKILGLWLRVRGHGQPSHGTYRLRDLPKTLFIYFSKEKQAKKLSWIVTLMKGTPHAKSVVYCKPNIGLIHKLRKLLPKTRYKMLFDSFTF